MRTTSLMISNYGVPCPCLCRYCLLSSCRETSGVSWERGRDYARRFHAWARQARPTLPVHHLIGYCMDTPHLNDYLALTREMNCPWQGFLQLNGLAFRTDAELEGFLLNLKSQGIRTIDLTFYGGEDYHDRFAGRRGDYAHMERLLQSASCLDLEISVSLPVVQDNMMETAGLVERFAPLPGVTCRAFLPHSKGRGAALNHLRLTRSDYNALPEVVRKHFSKAELRTEGEWIALGAYPQPETRVLNLVLKAQDMDELEKKPFNQVIEELEKMHDDWLTVMPSPAQLAARYGNRENEQLFRLRDLVLLWRQRYMADHPDVYDMTDERHTCVL